MSLAPSPSAPINVELRISPDVISENSTATSVLDESVIINELSNLFIVQPSNVTPGLSFPSKSTSTSFNDISEPGSQIIPLC